MALVVSRATGNWLTAGTWETVDATSLVNSEAATGVVTTSYTASAGATTGIINATGIGVKLSVRTGTTGTFTTHLAIAGVEVPGTVVQINTADFPVAATADLNGGWQFFQFASPVTLAGATSYTVECKTSSSTQISLFSTATTAWSHFIATDAAAAPTTGDDTIVCGEYISEGVANAFVVTYDETATTDYGAAPTAAVSLVQPGIAVSKGGTFQFQATAATGYDLKISNSVLIYSGGVIDHAAAMPRDSSLNWQFDCGANVDYGLTVRNLGTWNPQGLSRTSGKLIDRCKLNTDENVNATVLGVDTDTGWLDNDVIAVASTTRTNTQCESGTINATVTATEITVDGFAGAGGGLAFAHSGTSPTAAEVILLTRNVLIQGASASLQAYIDLKATAIVNADWAEFKWMGSATALKRGIDTGATTGVQTFNNCSFNNFAVTSSIITITGASGSGLNFTDNVFYAINSTINVAVTTGVPVMTNNIFMLTTGSAQRWILLNDIGLTFTNNTMTGATGEGFNLFESGGRMVNVSGNVSHSNATSGLSVAANITGELTGTTNIWRNGGAGVTMTTGVYTIYGLTAFGNLTNNITISGAQLTLSEPVLNGDSTFATTNGISISSNTQAGVTIYSGNFGTVGGIKTAHTADILCNANVFMRYFLNNTILASGTEVSGPSSMLEGSFVSSQRHDQTDNLHKTWKRYGILTIETTTVHSPGVTSLKMTPNNASFKLDSAGRFGGFKVQVGDGQTCTPTIYVQEDGSYNGNRARLIVKRNDAMGISADTVLDTATAASDAAWEALTGTTAAVIDNGTLEFIIDCDGTAGNLFVGSASAVNA